MEGIATKLDNLLAQDTVAAELSAEQSFASSVQQSLQNYFAKLDGADPSELYKMVLAEMEVPLLKTVMRYTNSNQSKAAKILGISRGTLRKKIATYKIDPVN